MSQAFDIALTAAKTNFFDRGSVIRSVNQANMKNLKRFGAFVRTSARGSIRKRKGASAPGKPPHSHVGTLKRFIYFGFDRSSDSVAIGPVLTNGGGTAPRSLEHGGRSLAIDRGKRKVKNIRKRPFMKPAFDAELKKVPDLWRNSVKAR